MANEETSVTEAGLSAKVDQIESQLRELKSATRTSVWVGRLVLLVIVIVIILQVVSVYKIFTNLDQEAYREAAQQEMENLLPKVFDQAGSLAEELAPVYQDALMNEFDRAMPEIAETFSREMDLFVTNVGENIEKSLEHRFQQVLDKQLEILAQDMPELRDDKKRKEIMDNVLDCAYGAAQHLSNDLFQPQIETVAELSATLDSARIPPELKKMNDSQLLYHTSGKLGDLIFLKMAILEDVFGEEAMKED